MSESLTIDNDLGEALHENEERLTQEIVNLISKGVRAQHQPAQRPALRSGHPKAHGCVKATFKVNDKLPPELAQGVFVPGTTYQAVIQFSNGDPDPMRPDVTKDARGMALKLFGVPGDKILPDERDAPTQDFVMINHPVFFFDDPDRYRKLQELQGMNQNPNMLRRVFSALTLNNEPLERFITLLALTPKVGIKSAKLFMKVVGSKIGSPLTTTYWSMSAYQLGDPPHKLAIKFRAHPRQADIPIPANPPRNYLRETMKDQLAAHNWQFDFALQRKPPNMSVENTMVEWPGPFEQVATITIPKQEFATPARDQFCEGLSFTPWHALPQHRPLGAVNRMRRVAYEAISKLRHELNDIQRREPTEQDVP